MNILAFDTATDACSVALHCNGQLLLDHQIKPQQQAALLLQTVDQLMSQARLTPSQLGGVVFGRGPGSFTGLRIAACAAQGIALGAGIGVKGVSSLDAVAQGCARETAARDILVLIDARLGEMYAARYFVDENGRLNRIGDEQLLKPEALKDVALQANDITLTGNGLSVHRDSIVAQFPEARFDEARLPCARDLIDLASNRLAIDSWLTPEEALPVYIRDKVALTEAERKPNTKPGML